MEGRAPVALMHPRGHCRQEQFYFRGGDVLTEPEYLEEQRKQAEERCARAQREHDKMVAQYTALQEELKRRYEYTSRVAPCRDDDRRLAKLDRERAELTAATDRLDKLEADIAEVRRVQSEAHREALKKERAMLATDIQAMKVEVEMGKDQLLEAKRDLVRQVRKPAFARALRKEAELAALRALNARMRDQWDRLFREMNEGKGRAARINWDQVFKDYAEKASAKGAKKADVDAFRAAIEELKGLLAERSELQQEVARLENRRFFARELSRQVLLGMIAQLEVLSDAYVSVGGERVDCEGLRRRVLALDENAREDTVQCFAFGPAAEEEEPEEAVDELRDD